MTKGIFSSSTLLAFLAATHLATAAATSLLQEKGQEAGAGVKPGGTNPVPPGEPPIDPPDDPDDPDDPDRDYDPKSDRPSLKPPSPIYAPTGSAPTELTGDDGEPAGTGPASKTRGGDPVGFGSGSLEREETLLSFPGRGIDLSLTLYMHSQWSVKGDLGFNWSSGWDQRLFVKHANGQTGAPLAADYFPGDHQWIRFGASPKAGVLQAKYGHFEKLRAGDPADGCDYVVRNPEGIEFRFVGKLWNGKTFVSWLTEIRHPNGSYLKIQRHPSQRIDRVEDDLGRWVQFSYYDGADYAKGLVVGINIGCVKRIDDFAGRTWSFEFDIGGNLSKLHQPSSPMWDESTPNKPGVTGFATKNISMTTHYAYTPQHFLSAVYEDADDGKPSLINKFGTNLLGTQSYGRVLKQIDANGFVTRFYYKKLLTGPLHPQTVNLARNAVLLVQRDGRAVYREMNLWGQTLLRRGFHNLPAPSSLTDSATLDQIMAGLTPAADTRFVYDLDGRAVETLYPEGNRLTFEFQTSADRFQQSIVRNCTEIAGPRGDGGSGMGAPDRTWQYSTDPLFGSPISMLDPAGNETKLVLDYQEAAALAASLANVATKWGISLATLPALNQGDVNGDGIVGDSLGEPILLRAPIIHGFDLSSPAAPLYTQGSTEIKVWRNSLGQLQDAIDAMGTRTHIEYGNQFGAPGYGRAKSIVGDFGGIGARVDYEYDLLGRVVKVSDARGVVSRMEYTPFGQLLHVVNAGELDASKAPAGLSAIPGAEARFAYDRDGNLVRSEHTRLVAPGTIRWVVSTSRFDAMKRLIEAEEQLDSDPSTGSISTRTQRYEYDGEGRPTRMLSPEATVAAPSSMASFETMRLFYDGRGLLCQALAGEGSGKEFWRSFQYDHNGNVTGVFAPPENAGGGALGCAGYPLGSGTTFVYDGFDRRTQVLGPAGEHSLVGYGPLDELLFSIISGPSDGVGSPISLLAAQQFSYDESGRMLRQDAAYLSPAGAMLPEDGNGDGWITNRLQYDKLGRVTASRNDRDALTQCSYDKLGRLLSLQDAAGNWGGLQYDAAGYMLLSKQFEAASNGGSGNLRTSAFEYDALGHLVKSLDHTGRASYAVYDFAGAPLFTADANGPLGGTNLPGINLTGAVNLPGNVTAYDYDDAGRLRHERHFLTASGLGDGQMPPTSWTSIAQTMKEYDRDDRLVKRVDPNGNATSFSFDELGRLAYEIRADGMHKSYLYDALSRPSLLRQEDGTELALNYDIAGYVASLTTPFAAPGVLPVTQSYRHDGLGRLTFAEESTNGGHIGAAHMNMALSRDSLGQIREERVTRTVPSLALAASSLGSIQAQYDGEGNRTKLLYPDGTSLSYVFDLIDRVERIDRQGSSFAQYEYLGGKLTQRLVQTGSKTLSLDAQYDEAENLVEMRHRANGTLLAGFGAHFDRLGHRLSEAHLEKGNEGELWQLDSLARMTHWKKSLPNLAAEIATPGGGGAAQETIAYQYDLTGNRIGKNRNGAAENFTSNVLNQIQPVTGVAYSYDMRGNLLSKGNSSFSYDALNRLRSYTVNGVTTEIVRDAMGRTQIEASYAAGQLVSKREFLHDGVRAIGEMSAIGATPASFKRWIHGVGLEELLVEDNSAHGSLFPLSSPLGSITALVNASGNVLERYEYPDGFGAPRFLDASGTELGASAYGFDKLFTGARYLQDAGLYDLRNRYYEPTLGRFLNPDPMGTWFDGNNLGNGYAYVGNNPMNLVDPFGFAGEEIHIPVRLFKRPGDKFVSATTMIPKPKPENQKVFENWGMGMGNSMFGFMFWPEMTAAPHPGSAGYTEGFVQGFGAMVGPISTGFATAVPKAPLGNVGKRATPSAASAPKAAAQAAETVETTIAPPKADATKPPEIAPPQVAPTSGKTYLRPGDPDRLISLPVSESTGTTMVNIRAEQLGSWTATYFEHAGPARRAATTDVLANAPDRIAYMTLDSLFNCTSSKLRISINQDGALIMIAENVEGINDFFLLNSDAVAAVMNEIGIKRPRSIHYITGEMNYKLMNSININLHKRSIFEDWSKMIDGMATSMGWKEAGEPLGYFLNKTKSDWQYVVQMNATFKSKP